MKLDIQLPRNNTARILHYRGRSPWRSMEMMVNAAEAREIIVQSLSPLPSEECPLRECGGRVLASEVVAPHDVPLFDNASMDGFAVCAADMGSASGSAPVVLQLTGEVPAGIRSAQGVESGKTLRIMTGAPLPKGADAVVEQELAETRNGSVTFVSPVVPGRNIRRRGEDVRQGEVILQKGQKLTPQAVGVLASLGIGKVDVYSRPRVALMTTGNEVVEVTKEPGPGQIRNSNAFALEGLLRESGAEVVLMGIVRDSLEDLKKAFTTALTFNAVVSSGGVSVGKFDLVPEAMKAAGVDIRFRKVNIKPGMPLTFGLYQTAGRPTVPVFALPGNPVSAMVTFGQFVRPGLEQLTGVQNAEGPLRIRAVLGEDLLKKDGKRHFTRGIARNDGAEIIVTTTGSQSSGVLSSMTKANCLIVIPEEVRDPKRGDEVEIELL